TATSALYTLSLHDALPIYSVKRSDGIQGRKLSDFVSLKIDAGDAKVLIYNICSISQAGRRGFESRLPLQETLPIVSLTQSPTFRSEEHTSELQSRSDLVCR